MLFSFPNPQTTDSREHRIQRFFEALPGALTWATILGMIVFSFLLPIWVAIFVIAFDLYWILRTVFIVSYSVSAYRNLRRGMHTDWWERCQNISHPKEYTAILEEKIARFRSALSESGSDRLRWRERRAVRKEMNAAKKYKQEVEEIIQNGAKVLDWREIVHIVMLPTANEDAEVIEGAIDAVKESNFPNEQIVILLATEASEPAAAREAKVRHLTKKFSGVFREFLVTTHTLKKGEMRCKASNATHAAREAQQYLDREKVAYTRVIFSNFDCDTVCHAEYFAALTYLYITDPNRLRRAYQPLPMYNNNIWDTNAFVRVIVLGSSFWHMFQSTRREMVTFSSHSEPFDTLVKVGFWPVNMISEDSIIYWKAYAYFGGDYRVKVVPLPVSLDAALAKSYVRTIANQYKQKRRWAYGVENLPIVMRSLFSDTRVSLARKLRVALEMIEGHHSWATAPFMLALLGWMPLIFGGAAFNESVIAHNLPFVTRYLMTMAMFGLVVSAPISFLLLPPRPKRYTRWRYVHFVLQWALVPITAPLLGALPAIDAQTRLMLGKYFGSFWVTEKVRRK